MPIYRANDPVLARGGPVANAPYTGPSQPVGTIPFSQLPSGGFAPTPGSPNSVMPMTGAQGPPTPTSQGIYDQVNAMANSLQRSGAPVMSMPERAGPDAGSFAPGTGYTTGMHGGRAAAMAEHTGQNAMMEQQQQASELANARQVWQSGNAGDKAALLKSGFVNQLMENPSLQKEFGFSDRQDVMSTVNGLYAGNLGGNLYDANSPAFARLGGTQGQYQAPSSQGMSTLPGMSQQGGQAPTYPLPGATPGQVPGTSWPSNNIGPGGPQQYFPPPNPNWLSSNNPSGATYQPTVPGGGKGGGAPPPQYGGGGGKMGAQPAPQMGIMPTGGGKFGR